MQGRMNIYEANVSDFSPLRITYEAKRVDMVYMKEDVWVVLVMLMNTGLGKYDYQVGFGAVIRNVNGMFFLWGSI